MLKLQSNTMAADQKNGVWKSRLPSGTNFPTVSLLPAWLAGWLAGWPAPQESLREWRTPLPYFYRLVFGSGPEPIPPMQTVVLTAYKLGLIYSQLAFPADIVLQTHISVAPDPQTHTRPPKQTWPTSLIRASRLRKRKRWMVMVRALVAP